MKKFVKKAVSLLIVTAMMAVLVPQNIVVQATKNETEVINYSELNDEIYENLEDYPTGDFENSGEIFEEAIQVESVDEYYQTVAEDVPMTCDGDEVTANLSAAVDNSTNENAKYFPPIVSQYGGSCTCYAFIYNLGSYTLNQARDTDASVSENQLNPLFVYNMTRSSDSTGVGTSSTNANKIIKNVGVPTADVAPIGPKYSNYCYTWYPTEEIWNSATEHRVGQTVFLKDFSHTGTPITSVDDEDLNLIKTTLSDGKIIAFATAFYSFNYTVIPNDSPSHAGEHAVDRCDRYVSNGTGRNYGGHAMVIVGYDDNIWIDVNRDGQKQTGEFGAIKIANSHGSSYRNSGFVWVAYDALNKVSSVLTDSDVERINAAISAGTMTGNKIQNSYRLEFFWYKNYCYTYVASADGSEASNCRLVATLNTSDREDIEMYVTATEKNSGTSYYYTVEPFNRTTWSETYALDGSKTTADGTMVIDLNNVVPSVSEETINEYTWSVTICDLDSTSAPTTVKDLHIKVAGGKELTANVEDSVVDGTTKVYNMEQATVDVTDFTTSVASPVSLVENVTLSATATAGSGNYEYRFGSIFEGKEYEITDGYQSACSTIYQFSRMFPDATGMGTAEAAGTHTLFVDVKDTETGDVVRKTIENYQVKPLEITSFTADLASPQKVGTAIKLNAEVQYEAGYRYNTYKFTVIKDGVETNIAPYSSVQYSATWTPKEAGTYTVKYYVQDYLGQEATATMQYCIKEEQQSVVYYSTSWSQAYIHYKTGDGTWTTVPGVKMEADSTQSGYQWKCVIDLEDADEATVCFNDGNGTWDSQNGNNYSVGVGTYGIKNGSVNTLTVTPTATPTTVPTVTPTATATPTTVPTAIPTVTPTTTPTPTVVPIENATKVYYSNDAWSQAYIHYQVGDGTWTTVPGVKMEDSTSDNGYTWKYVIDLEDADNTTVCFNNGSGSWDSNNGSNYSLEKGVYGIKNGTIEELQEGLIVNVSADKEVGGTYNQTTFTAVAENGTEPYSYQFAVLEAGSTPTDTSYTVGKTDGTYNYTPYTAKDYTVYVKVTDAEGNVAETSMNYTVEGDKWGKFTAIADDRKVGTPVTLEAEYINYKEDSYNNYSFIVEKDGVSNTYSTGSTGYYVWTPTEAGTYTITAQFHAYTGEVYKTELTYEVTNGNTATIYYNSGWDNAYIHYCVEGGSWTTVPGVAMTKTSEKSGYTYKYVIDLDDAESVTVCFNNGNGSWDSNNGANYTISAGSYGVSSGSISEVK